MILIIIPISKLLGNYNIKAGGQAKVLIIPISKLLGNYNNSFLLKVEPSIIPISKLLGNYNFLRGGICLRFFLTTDISCQFNAAGNSLILIVEIVDR